MPAARLRVSIVCRIRARTGSSSLARRLWGCRSLVFLRVCLLLSLESSPGENQAKSVWRAPVSPCPPLGLAVDCAGGRGRVHPELGLSGLKCSSGPSVLSLWVMTDSRPVRLAGPAKAMAPRQAARWVTCWHLGCHASWLIRVIGRFCLSAPGDPSPRGWRSDLAPSCLQDLLPASRDHTPPRPARTGLALCGVPGLALFHLMLPRWLLRATCSRPRCHLCGRKPPSESR